MEFLIVIAGAVLLAGLIRVLADRMLSGEDKKAARRERAIAEGAELTAGLVKRAEETDFLRQTEELGIQVEELSACGAKLIGMKEEEDASFSLGKDSPPPGDDPGEQVVLVLRWKNTGEKAVTRVTFAAAFLSPRGEVLRPDALDPDPWIRRFGCAAAVSFAGRFAPGQGRMQKDMRNPFLLYRAPVERAVLLGVRAEWEDGTVKEKTVL